MQKKDDPKKNSRGESRIDPRAFIDNHPARQGNLQKTTDRSLYEMGSYVPQIPEWQAKISQRFLVYHESDPNGQEDNNWMDELKQDSMKFIAEQKGVQLQDLYRQTVYKKGIETLTDKLFSVLQRFMYEFNQVAAGTDLHVSGTISGDVNEVLRYNRFREVEESVSYFRARLATRFVVLSMRGKDDKIEFFILPANKAMAGSACEVQYQPLATIQVKITDQGMMWRMKDSQPPLETMDELAMWLFKALVDQTKEASKSEESSPTADSRDK